MLTASMRRTAIPLLLLTLLVTPWAASASGPQTDSPRSARTIEEPSLLIRALSFLESLWSNTDCHINPWGQCAKEPASVQTKAGCNIDPWGRCL